MYKQTLGMKSKIINAIPTLFAVFFIFILSKVKNSSGGMFWVVKFKAKNHSQIKIVSFFLIFLMFSSVFYRFALLSFL